MRRGILAGNDHKTLAFGTKCGHTESATTTAQFVKCIFPGWVATSWSRSLAPFEMPFNVLGNPLRVLWQKKKNWTRSSNRSQIFPVTWHYAEGMHHQCYRRKGLPVRLRTNSLHFKYQKWMTTFKSIVLLLPKHQQFFATGSHLTNTKSQVKSKQRNTQLPLAQ